MLNRRTLIVSAIAALLAPTAVAAATIKIGVLLPFSGTSASLGQQIDRGIELYMKLHPKVPGGHKIDLIKRDTTGPIPNVAKRLAQELITRDKVAMLTGVVFSNNALAIAELSRRARIPFIIMNAGDAALTTKSPYIARVSFTMWQAAYPLGKYAYDHMGIKTAAVMYANYAPGVDSKNAFVAAFTKAGGKIVLDIPFPFPQIPDFTPFLQRVKDAKPDAIYAFTPSGKWATAMMKTYGDLGLAQAGIKLIGPGDLVPDSELANMGDTPLGLITVHHYSAAANRPSNKKFVAAWHKAYGASSMPDFMGVQGYDGMAAIYHIIAKDGAKITGASAMKAVEGWKFESPQGPIMIDPKTRDIVDNQYLRKTEKVNGRLENVEIKTFPMVKDPWKELHDKK